MRSILINDLIIFTECDTVSEWVNASILLTKLRIKRIKKISSVDILNDIKASFIIVTEDKYKLLNRYLKSSYKQIPVLVLTEDFHSFHVPDANNLIVDILPIPATTLGLLEHIIKSITNDFRQNQKLTTLAHYDTLTGAANRLLFTDRLKEAYKEGKRTKQGLCLLYFDLDNFKPINDKYGHQTGDEVLKRFVKLISELCRNTDTLARIGGDEFVLLLPHTQNSTLEIICQKVVACLSVPQQFENVQIEIMSSIGAVYKNFSGDDNSDIETLLKKADQAVYLAKNDPFTSYQVFIG